MQIENYVNIIEANVYGIRNPNYIINGEVFLNDEYEVRILVDGVKVVVQNNIFNSKNFFIKIPLSRDQREIKTYLIYADKEYLICSRKNSCLKRIKSKLRKLLASSGKVLKKLNRLIYALYKAVRYLWREHHFIVPIALWKPYLKKLKLKISGINYGTDLLNPMVQEDYLQWLKTNDVLSEPIEKFSYTPLISMVIPVYNISEKYLSECIESILSQTYSNFEICLVDDCSNKKETITTLNKYLKKDKRIKVKFREENGHISKSSNDAINMASGEFIGLMDNDDLLTENALYEVVKVLNNNPNLDMIYSDEDKIDLKGKRRDPHFKPDFSPDSLLSSNYICHFTVLRRDLVLKIGGFRIGYEGSQDHDLFLRFTEKTKNIYHIKKVLYHWRMIPGSTAATIDSKNYAVERGKKSVEDALERRGIPAKVSIHEKIPYYMIDYLYEDEPKISIIIPTRDHYDITKACIDSIYDKTLYKNFEVIVVNNGSKEKETYELFDNYANGYENFKVIDYNDEFNYSIINNIAVEQCNGDYIVLLNNDTEVITPNWLNTMVGYAMQKHIGTVGVKLLYPDNTVQHGGIVMGIGGVAQHAFLEEPRESYGLYARLAIPYNVSGNTAACLMIEKSKYRQIGGLEEQLKVAFNDVDLNLKAIDAGFYNIFLPQVELYHHESKSRGLDTTTEKYKRFLQEQKFMENKWRKKLYNDPFYNTNFSMKKAFFLDAGGEFSETKTKNQ